MFKVITTKYRMDKFGKAEQKKAVTIDRIYPFHSDHITVCAGDAADPNDLVTTLNMDDYAPDKEEEDKLMQEEESNEGEVFSDIDLDEETQLIKGNSLGRAEQF